MGSRSACSRVFHAATVRSAVSTAICHSGLAGIRAVSAKRRIWSGVISDKAAAVAETQGERVVGNIRKRCHKIVARREHGRAPVGIEQRPVLEMHVGIADQHGEHEAADEFPDGVLTRFPPTGRTAMFA